MRKPDTQICNSREERKKHDTLNGYCEACGKEIFYPEEYRDVPVKVCFGCGADIIIKGGWESIPLQKEGESV